jgi:hypothetical protein
VNDHLFSGKPVDTLATQHKMQQKKYEHTAQVLKKAAKRADN